MACLSEIYFHSVMTDWSDEGQAGRLISSGSSVLFSTLCVRYCIFEGTVTVRSWVCVQRMWYSAKTVLSYSRRCRSNSHPCRS